LFPDTLRVAFAPDQVVIERRTIKWTLTGVERRLVQREILPVAGRDSGRVWDEALRVLAAALEGQSGTHIAVTVILANSLVRYALVPQTGHLDPDEEASVLRHCFCEIYGDAAEQWQLRVSPINGRPLQPASGVDQALLASLRRLFTDRRFRLRSIQPRLMAVCSEHRVALGADSAWLLLFEPSNLCLGLIAEGRVARLRSLRIGADWAAELPWLLEREAILAELDEAPDDVLLWHRDGVVQTLPATGSLRMHPLQDLQSAEAVAASGKALAPVPG
jgi:hypothetical protein